MGNPDGFLLCGDICWVDCINPTYCYCLLPCGMLKVLLVLPDHPYMTAVADEIWAILREFAAGQKELQAAQKETVVV